MLKKVRLCSKKLIFHLFFLFISYASFSQNPTAKSDFWNHVRFGGGIGLGFTNGGFNGSIAPSAIYQFNDQFASGVSLNFNYAKFDNDKFLAYGGSILSLYNPIPYLQLSAEFEQLRINREVNIGTASFASSDFWSPGLFLGVGYRQQNFTVGIRYDILFDESTSINANAWAPFVRVYF